MQVYARAPRSIIFTRICLAITIPLFSFSAAHLYAQDTEETPATPTGEHQIFLPQVAGEADIDAPQEEETATESAATVSEIIDVPE